MLLASLPLQEGCLTFSRLNAGRAFMLDTKRIWPRAIKLAGLAGVTPHTLRHTLGSTAVSFGELLKMTGAILGHATAAATEVYAHMQHNPSKGAADRVSETISAALKGNPAAEIIPLRHGANG